MNYTTTGAVLVGKLSKYCRVIRFAEYYGFSEDIHSRVYEMLELAGILHRLSQITDADFERINNAQRQFERAYDGVDMVMEVNHES